MKSVSINSVKIWEHSRQFIFDHWFCITQIWTNNNYCQFKSLHNLFAMTTTCFCSSLYLPMLRHSMFNIIHFSFPTFSFIWIKQTPQVCQKHSSKKDKIGSRDFNNENCEEKWQKQIWNAELRANNNDHHFRNMHKYNARINLCFFRSTNVCLN